MARDKQSTCQREILKKFIYLFESTSNAMLTLLSRCFVSLFSNTQCNACILAQEADCGGEALKRRGHLQTSPFRVLNNIVVQQDGLVDNHHAMHRLVPISPGEHTIHALNIECTHHHVKARRRRR